MNILKTLGKLIIVLFVLCCSIFVQVKAAEQETTVTFANVNNKEYFDVEIMQDKNGNFLLPTKQIADILEIPLKINHSTKDLTFDNIKITKTYVFKNGAKVSLNQNKYLKSGMMPDVRDEIYCSAKVLSEIFSANISINKSDLSVVIKTDKKFSREINDKITETAKEEEKPFKAYIDVKHPNKKKNITLDTIQFDNSMMSDSATQVYQTTRDKNIMFNNTGRIKLKGEAYQGDWEADLSGNNYKGQLFSFSGMSFKYQNKYKDYNYQIGKVDGFQNETYQLGTQLIGAQIFDYNPQKEDIKKIKGFVDKTSLVNVYINDKFQTTLSTYDGEYNLNDFYCNVEKINKIVLKELKDNGSESVIYTKTYPKYYQDGFVMEQKEKRHSAFIGVSGFNDRLFAQDGYLYQMNSKKLTAGIQEQYCLRDNVISDTKLLYDRIISKPKDVIWAQNYYNNHSILSMGTYKNPNSLEGFTMLNTTSWRINDLWKLNSDIGFSQSKDISQENQNLVGYTFALNSIYEKNNFMLKLGAYNQSPDFYMAGSEWGFISDRLGGKIGVDYKHKDWHMSGTYNKFCSNTSGRYDGGLVDFNELNFNIGGRIKNIAQVRYNFNGRKGQNQIGENISYFQDFNITKYFRNGLSLEGGKQESSYSSEFFDANAQTSGFTSLYSTIYLKAGILIPKNKGKLELGHDQINYVSNNIPNKYNMIKLNYIFPEMKRFLLACGLGYKYGGNDKGLNYNATIGYRTKSGMIVSMGYRYDTNGGYLIDNMYIPTSQRHSINLTINDTFAVMPSGLKSIGQADDSKGFVEVIAYLDKNNNNIYDEGDIGVENVPIKLSWMNDVVYTDKNGKIPVATAENGVYKVKVDNEKLQGNLSVAKNTKESRLIVVQPKKQTDVTFKITSSVGNIKGNIKVIDDFGRIKSIRDFIIVIHDENDKEIAYSTVDENGNYYFSGIAPGKYQIMLDENFVNEYNLMTFEDKGKISIDIPFVYKDFVDITEQNLVYKAW